MSKNWLGYNEAYRQEEDERLNTDFSKLCNFGIKCLDDSLLAITKNELIVIGADSGTGKSDMILDIAMHNAKNGKCVALLYLEGGHLEAMRRIKFKDIANHYYKHRENKEYRDIDFRRWVLNCGDNLTDISAEVYLEKSKLYKDNLFLYPISEGFKIEELLRSLMDFHTPTITLEDPFGNNSRASSLDLIIIDHLQYFSLNRDDNEITEITKIIREVKKITDHYNIPVILVSHLRKKGRDRGLPDQEDFYGSSNIPKIATTAITITPDSQEDDLANNIFPTFFRIVKSRIGIRPNYAMRCNYNLSLRKYQEQYKVFRLDNLGNIVLPELLDAQLPKWAKDKEIKDD